MSKNVLITGATGFLGKAIMAAAPPDFQVSSLGRSNENTFQVDLSNSIPSFSTEFDLVVHNAGLAHTVPKTDAEARLFYLVNVVGTMNLLNGLELSGKLPSQFIFISSVSVYGLEEGTMVTEDEPLAGVSPYAQSKITAEQIIHEWCATNNVHCTSLRLPLVVGKNAPGNLGSLTNAIKSGKYFSIKGNPSHKSVVNASDVAKLIYTINNKNGVFNLTDGVHPSFNQIEYAIAKECSKEIKIALPLSVVSFAAKIGDLLNLLHLPSPLNTPKLKKMITTLTFSDEKSRKSLGWNPNPAFSHY